MSKFIKLKKGFDIKLVGKAEKKLANFAQPETFAIKLTDFNGLQRPKVLVQEGDHVKAGSPLFFDKLNEKIKFTSPISGEIVEIQRGEKRRPLLIKILADKDISYVDFVKYTPSQLSTLKKEEILDALLTSGVWPNIIQRPFGVIANPQHTPKSIFVSTFDTSPLAPDYAFALRGEDHYFQAGISILKKLTSGNVHVNINADAEVDSIFSQVKEAQINKISGLHPAGNVGVQIHHIDPINKGEMIWTTTPYGVVQIGKLFLEGRYDASKIIALAGSEVQNPQYYKTYPGACIDKFMANNLKNPAENVRFISGNVLVGERLNADGYLGFYHNMLTVIPEGNYYDFLGWILPGSKTSRQLSFQRAFGLLSFLNPKKEYRLDTNIHGEERPFVQTGVFEKVVPMDIYPVYLLKAILARDYDSMEALGIYEVVEEDFALCEFVDVSKNDIQNILREGIELIQNS